MSCRHSYERWLLAIDVRADDAIPPAIVVRRVLKHLWRTWSLRCTGLSIDAELMRLRQDNDKLRKIIDGLAARVAAQSELLAGRSEKKGTGPCFSTTIGGRS